MNLNDSDVIWLNDGNVYVVVSAIMYNQKKYYFIADIMHKKNLRYVYEDGNELVDIDDEQELNNVIFRMNGNVSEQSSSVKLGGKRR